MRINPFLYGILVVLVFLGVIYGFQTAGLWSVSGKVTASGEAVQPLPDDVNTIKGWMTLEQIITVYPVSLNQLVAQFDLPTDTPASAALKDLESDTFSVTDLRDWLAAVLSTPADPVDEPAQAPDEPLPAATVVPGVAAPDAGQVEMLAEPTDPQTAESVAETPVPTEHVPVAGTVTGKTTFQELLDWGVAPEAIEAILGGSLPDPAQVIKDYANAREMDFATLKTELQGVVP